MCSLCSLNGQDREPQAALQWGDRQEPLEDSPLFHQDRGHGWRGLSVSIVYSKAVRLVS